MRSTYYTVKGYSEQEIIIQKSRFIAHIKGVTSEEEAQQFLQEIKKQHWDANHNCYAYCIGENNAIQKANDDGEPSGTAGIPILEVIKKKNLNDTIIIITRYFGGIKLGAGGLIRAYGKCASEGVNCSNIIKRQPMTPMKTKIDYTMLGRVENSIRSSKYILKGIEYTDQVAINTLVECGLEDEFTEWMIDITNGQCQNSSGSVIMFEKTTKS
jgi:uncharacterized YigZ family protein